jgi:hypothetical protein
MQQKELRKQPSYFTSLTVSTVILGNWAFDS